MDSKVHRIQSKPGIIMSQHERELQSAARDDLPSIIALAILAACTTACAHEALGHGSACLFLGGRITMLTNAFFRCSAHSPMIDIAGPAGNLLVGLIAFVVQGRVMQPALRFYALCVMAFSLFWEAGYLTFAMLRNHGDYVSAWTDFVGPTTWTVRLGGIALGIAAYVVFSRMLAFRARAFADRPGRVPHLLRPAWLTGVMAMAVSALLFAPDRYGAVHDAGLSVASAFPLLYPYASLKPAGESVSNVARDWRIIAGGLGAFVVFALTMGRGLY